MRRAMLMVTSLVVAAAVAVSGFAVATTGDEQVSLGLQERWTEWAFGSSVNPLLQEDFCGEIVNGTFFMTVTGGAPESVTRHIDCEVPEGTPLLVTPGGAITWAPTDGQTYNELFESLLRNYLADVILRSVKVELDGKALDVGPLTINHMRLSLKPGNLIQTVDPAVTGDSTRIAFGWWFVAITDLEPGEHTLIASDKFRNGVRFRTVFTINVVPAGY